MSLRGELVIECDRPTCHAELVLSVEDADVEAILHVGGGIVLTLSAHGWREDREGGYVCPECAEDNPRDRDDDDGIQYADPRDEREARL